ncbi:MAG: hypothetical protein HQK87_11780, partial [Nitrospinae bacterium]|nr:hypothetical protein [Nitrospinota bacterium]
MGLETGSYISALVATNPVGATDPKSQGDDHLRFIKAKILETFPNITGAVTASHTELNLIASVNSLARFAAAGGTDTITVSYTNSVRLVDGVEFLVRAAGANTITNPVFDPIGVAATVTMTIASPCVVTHTAHGRYEAEPVVFTTSGALPTGLTAGTTYYIKSPTTNTYNVAETPGGTAIDTSGSQSGTHTATVGKHTLYKQGGAALVAGDIVGAGHEVTIRFRQNPARYELLDAGYLSSSGGTLAGVLNLKTGTLISISASLSGTTAALNLTSATGNGLHIAGTLTVSTVTLGSGMFRTVIFDGDAKLLHHATKLNLPGEANITAATNDRATFWSDGTTVYCIDYTKANGAPVLLPVASQAEMEAVSSNAVAVTPGTAVYHPGMAKAWCVVDVSGGTPTLTANYGVSSITDN